MLPVIARTYEVVLAAAAIFAIHRFKSVNVGTKYLCVLLWLEAITEAISKFFTIKYHDNTAAYNISAFLEFAIICLFFNQIIGEFKRKHIGIFVAAFGLLFGIVNMIFFQPITVINSNFVFFECLCVTCLCLFAMQRMLFDSDLQLVRETYFWISVILLFYQCASLWNWGIYSYILRHSVEKTVLMNISLLLINIIAYCAYFLILLFYPKMHRTDV